MLGIETIVSVGDKQTVGGSRNIRLIDVTIGSVRDERSSRRPGTARVRTL